MKALINQLRSPKIINVILLLLVGLAHLGILLLGVLSYRYFGLQKQLALALVLFAIAILFVLNVTLYVANRYHDHKLKATTLVVATLVLVVSLAGSFFLRRINRTVAKVLENSEAVQYETMYVSFATNNPSIKDVQDVAGKRFGILASQEENSVASLTKAELERLGITANLVEYRNSNELLVSLFNKEIDVASFQTSYRSMYKTEKGYEEHLANITDFYHFEKNVKTGENKSANTDLSSTPFNILLIGYAPEPGGTSGLADTIIVASVNPKTMTVSLSSIARDTYVPIQCWGGTYSKVNSARSESRSCLMDTVGDLLDTTIDFYMEVNFKGIVDIVNALGGIWIESPVEFVGQNSSSDRGEYTVWVGKGGQTVDGEQALAFARERYAMPNGDFDRQQHQKQVISQIVEKLLATRDVNKALAVMDAAGDNLSTNLSLPQLTGIFNYITNYGNSSGLSNFQTIDIQNLRITGYPSWYYNESARLPLWIYKPYKGSIAETKHHMTDVLGEYGQGDIEQQYFFKFFVEYPYNRKPLFSLYFNEAEEHEKMPTFYPDLTTMSLEEAQAWADANGVILEITYIREGDPGYNAGSVGRVISQIVKYGELTRNAPVCPIVVMGQPLSDEDRVPNFVGDQLAVVERWAYENAYQLTYIYTDQGEYGVIQAQNIQAGLDKRKFKEIVITVRDYPTIDITSLVAGKKAGAAYDALVNAGFRYILVINESNGWRDREIIDYSHAQAKINQEISLTVQKAVVTTPTPTPTVEPTPTPTVEPTPTPTVEPTPEPTQDTTTPTTGESGAGETQNP